MVAPRLSGTVARRLRRRLWQSQKKRCYWCDKKVILPEDLLRKYIPLSSIYDEGLADQLPGLHAQLMSRVPEFRRRWKNDLGTLDHLVEHARGGSHEITNLVLACAPCNELRGRRFQQLLLESDEDLWLESPDAASTIPVIVPPVRDGDRTEHRPMRG
jgi:5-methylcytosine-specific restriction endonuclease McrA